jgi:hypothetical protein
MFLAAPEVQTDLNSRLLHFYEIVLGALLFVRFVVHGVKEIIREIRKK